VTPSPIENYFLVARGGTMFHGAIAEEDVRAADNVPLLAHATRAEQLPGVLAFGFQVPLFRIGGASGAAIKIEFSGDDLGEVSQAAGASFGALMGAFGPGTVQPDPPNFNLPTPEVQVRPDHRRLAEVGLTPAALGESVQAAGRACSWASTAPRATPSTPTCSIGEVRARKASTASGTFPSRRLRARSCRWGVSPRSCRPPRCRRSTASIGVAP